MLAVKIIKGVFSKKNQDIFRNAKALYALGVGLFINLVGWAYLLINVRPQENPIFLHYNIYYGVDLIGDWYQIFLMPLAGSIVFLVHLVLSRELYSRDRVLGYILIGITIVLEIIILGASYLLLTQSF